MRYKIIILFYLLLSNFLFSEVFNVGLAIAEENPMFNVSKIILTELSRVHGDIEFNLISMPNKRCRISLLEGSLDGDLFRSKFVYENTNAICIEIPLLNIPYAIFTDKKKYTENYSLNNKRIGMINGDQSAINYLDKNNLKYEELRQDANLFNMLIKNRVDTIVMPYVNRALLDKTEFKDSIETILPPLFVEPFYLFISEKQIDKKESIERALQEVIDSGFLKPYLSMYNID